MDNAAYVCDRTVRKRDRQHEGRHQLHRNNPHLKYCPKLYLGKLFLGLPVAGEGDAGCGPAVPVVVHPLPLPLPSNTGCRLFWLAVFVVVSCAGKYMIFRHFHAAPKIVFSL